MFFFGSHIAVVVQAFFLLREGWKRISFLPGLLGLAKRYERISPTPAISGRGRAQFQERIILHLLFL